MSAPIWSVTWAADCWSDWASVLTAMNSTPATSASIMRLTAFTPPPPTPTTRSTGPCWPGRRAIATSSSAWARRGMTRGASSMFSGISEEKAARRRSCGVGGAISGSCGAGALGEDSEGCGADAAASRSAAAAASAAASVVASDGATPSSSVLRKRAASGPSLMLARLPLAIAEDLLRERPIGMGRDAVRVVLQHRHALHGSLCETDRLPDPGREHPVPEVLLEDLDRLLGVQGPRVEERGQDALDLDVGVEVLADHRERVLELDEAPHRQILALHGD